MKLPESIPWMLTCSKCKQKHDAEKHIESYCPHCGSKDAAFYNDDYKFNITVEILVPEGFIEPRKFIIKED